MDAADKAVETARGTPAARDADGHSEFSAAIAVGPVQSVHQDFRLSGAAVDVNADVAGDLRTVICGGEVIPAIGGECLFGFDADSIIDPDAGEVDVNLAVIHIEAEAFAVRVVDHFGDDAAVRG